MLRRTVPRWQVWNCHRKKGVQRERLAHTLLARYSVLHRCNAEQKIGGFLLRFGDVCRPAYRRQISPKALAGRARKRGARQRYGGVHRVLATPQNPLVNGGNMFCCGLKKDTRKGEKLAEQYTILRFRKYKRGGVYGIQKHNERQKTEYKSNPDIDLERVKQNYHIHVPEPCGYRKQLDTLVEEAKCRRRKDSVYMLEALITSTPSFFEGKSLEEQRAYFERAYEFMAERVGRKNIISAVVHMDEKSPHMHFCFCPLTKDNRLCAKEITGNPQHLSDYWQTGFFEYMSQTYPDLVRGKSAKETRRKHIPTWLFKQSERLDKLYSEVEAVLSDIGMFNAKGKSEQALAILREWYPVANYFNAQVKKSEGRVKELEEKVEVLKDGIAERDKTSLKYLNETFELKYENEELQLAVEKLQRQNEAHQRLIERIPPDILAQLQKELQDKKRDRRDRGWSR